MSEQIIRDENGRTIAKIREEGRRLVLRDTGGRMIGFYDADRDETRDANNGLIGKGNLLAMLLC